MSSFRMLLRWRAAALAGCTLVLAAIAGPESVDAASSDQPLRSWEKIVAPSTQARAVTWDETTVVLETASRQYLVRPLSELSPADRIYLASLPTPEISTRSQGFGPMPIASEIPGQPTRGFDGVPVAFNGRYFVIAEPNGQISPTVHVFAAVGENARRTLLEQFRGRLSGEERLLAAATTHEAVWLATDEEKPLPADVVGEGVPSGVVPVAFDGERFVYRPAKAAAGAAGPFAVVRVSEADTKRASIREYLLQQFIARPSILAGNATPSLLQSLAAAERLQAAPTGKSRFWTGKSLRGGSPNGAWVRREGTACLIVREDGTLDVIDPLSEEDLAWLRETGDADVAETPVIEPPPSLEWTNWSFLPVGTEARLAFFDDQRVFVEKRDGYYVEVRLLSLTEAERQRLADLPKPELDTVKMRLEPTEWVIEHAGWAMGTVDRAPVAFTGRHFLLIDDEGRVTGSSRDVMAFDRPTRRALLERFSRSLDEPQILRAAAYSGQLLWKQDPAEQAPSYEGAPARAFDGDYALLELSDAAAQVGSELDKALGFRLQPLVAPQQGPELELAWSLRARSENAGAPLPEAFPFVKRSLADAGRGEAPLVGELRTWNSRLFRHRSPTEGRLVFRNDRTAAIVTTGGELDLIVTLSEEDAAYLREVEGFYPPSHTDAEEVAYRAGSPDVEGAMDSLYDERTWSTWPAVDRAAKLIYADETAAAIRDAEGEILFLRRADLSPEDRRYLAGVPRPVLPLPPAKYVPSWRADKFPGHLTQPFDAVPVAFEGVSIVFARPNGELIQPAHDMGALSKESHRQLLDHLDASLTDEQRIAATMRTHQTVWLEPNDQVSEQLPQLPRTDVYSALDRAVAFDGENVIIEKRAPVGEDDSYLRPRFEFIRLGAFTPTYHDALDQEMRERFLAGSRPLPWTENEKLLAALQRNGRSDPPTLGERRLWEGGLVDHFGPIHARLYRRLPNGCVVIADDGRVDIVAKLTQADVAYLNSIDGFYSPTATERDRAPAERTPDVDLLKEASKRLAAGDLDAETLRELDDRLAALRGAAPFEPTLVQELKLRINQLAESLWNADDRWRESETQRVSAQIASGSIPKATGEIELRRIAAEPLDPTNDSNPSERLIAIWKKERPDSSFPLTLEGLSLFRHAWKARGSGYAHEVDEEEGRVYQRLMEQAEPIVNEAVRRTPDDYYLRSFQLSVGRSLGYDLERTREIYEAGVAANPRYAELHQSLAFTLLPRWYGEPGDIGALGDELLERFPGGDGAEAFLCVLKQHLRYEPEILKTEEYSPQSLSRVAGYLAEAFPDSVADQVFAEYLAYYAGDFDLAWRLKRRTLGSHDPALHAARQKLFTDVNLKAFYERLAEPPDLRRAVRFDQAQLDAPHPTMAFADHRRLCAIAFGDGESRAIDALTMRPDPSFRPPSLKDFLYIGNSDYGWLAAVGTDDDGTRQIVSLDAAGEREPVVLEAADANVDAASLAALADLLVGAVETDRGPVLVIWDATTGLQMDPLPLPFPARQAVRSESGGFLALWDGDTKLAFLEAALDKPLEQVQIPDGCHFPQFLPDGRLALLRRTGSAAEPSWNVVVVDPTTREVTELSKPWRSQLPAFGDVALSEDLSTLFVIPHPAGGRGWRITVLDADSGAILTALDGHFAPPVQLEYRADVQRLYSLGADRHFIEWDVSPAGLSAAKEREGRR